MANPNSKNRAAAELVFAAFLWGSGFIFMRLGLSGFTPIWLTVLRFAIHVVMSAGLLLWLPQVRGLLSWKQVQIASVAGLALGGAQAFQTVGLQYTSVSKSGFITVLYIVLVPFLEAYWIGRRIRFFHWFAVAIALAGAALISGVQMGDWNKGDLFTLGCAVLSAVQIVGIERVNRDINSPFLFNTFQSMWGIVALAPLLPLERLPVFPVPPMALFALVAVSVLSTQVAFLIQVRAQRVLSSSVCSMICLLESPVAAGIAYFVFGDVLSPLQWLGAGLITGAAVLVIVRAE